MYIEKLSAIKTNKICNLIGNRLITKHQAGKYK